MNIISFLNVSECRELEQLLADMRSSLFNLQVGAQALPEQPLGEAVAVLADKKKRLLHLISKANGA